MATSAPNLPLADACQRLGLSHAAGYRLMLQGRLAGVRVGGRWHVDLASLERFEKARKTESTTQVRA